MYDLGVLGGMGPEATLYFCNLIIENTNATKDQDHLTTAILINSKIPDRTTYILGHGPSPLPEIIKSLDKLNTISNYLVVTCNTAHYFQEEYRNKYGSKFISIIDICKNYIEGVYHNSKIVLLATEGTISSDLYRSETILIEYPNKKIQKEVNGFIRDIKSKDLPLTSIGTLFNSYLKNSFDDSTVFILGCTELSMISEYLEFEIVDPLVLTALEVIRRIGDSV